MKAVLPVAFLATAVSCWLWAKKPEERVLHRESTEWCDVWMPDMTSTNLPRVLLVGDSITRGYYPEVEVHLKGKAYTARLTTSKAVGDTALPAELMTFISQVPFDVIHFNVGMHGWDYTDAEYRRYLPEVLQAIRKSSDAKLIWASTTPVRKDYPRGPTMERIERRNAIAAEYFNRQKIPIDDLFSLVANRPELHSDDIHFNSEGTSILARQVADEILKVLPPKKAK